MPKKPKATPAFLPSQAKLIVEAHSLDDILHNDEEREMLEKHNPELLEAIQAILKYAGVE